MTARFIALVSISVLLATASGYENGMLNLEVPYSGMEKGSLEFSVNHRFRGDAFEDPFGDFFGMDLGANVAIGLKYFPMEEIDIRFSHTTTLKRITAGAGWSRALGGPGIESCIVAGYTSVEPLPDQDREGGFLGLVSFSAGPFSERYILVASYAYDGYAEKNGPGFGFEIILSDRFSLIGEYFPVVDRQEGDFPENTFSLSGRYSTWGHQFMLGFSNSQGIGIWEQLSGVPNNDMTVSFSLRRLFSL